MHYALLARIDSILADDSQTLVAEYRAGGDDSLADAIASREATWSPTRLLFAVYAPDGRRIMGTFSAAMPPVGQGDVGFNDVHDHRFETARALTVDLGSGRRLTVAADLDSTRPIVRAVLFVFVLALFGVLLLGVIGATLLGAYLRRRLNSINVSARAIIGGDIGQRMPVGPRGDEFDQLGTTLNHMLDRIETLLDNLRQVSSDIAHDLRTPLARLRARLEQGLGDREGRGTALISEAIERVDDVLILFAAILRIAEVESGETKRLFRPFDLSVLVGNLSESFTLSFEDHGRTLLSSIEPSVVIDGDRELIAQAIINLLENAERHTPRGAIVRLTLVRTGPCACVAVVDNGTGVPASQLHRITQRFTRLSADRNTPGHGLGLSLVTAVAGLHCGRLVLRNAEPGLSAMLEFPIANVIRVEAGRLNLGEKTNQRAAAEVK